MNIKEQQELWNNPDNWVNDGHEWSTYFKTTDNLWKIIYPKFKNYLNGEVLEIAPGYGRITKYLLEKNINLCVIDLNEICITECKKKFGDKIKSYIINDGKSIDFDDNTFDFIFSFDSFVHMTSGVIEHYIIEINRTLKNNSYAFIHHSFFYGDEKPTNNRGGRSNMNPELFRTIIEKYNMKLISQEDFKTSENINDTISIIKK